MRLVAGFVLNQELSSVVFYTSFMWIMLIDFVLRSTGKAMGEHGIKWRRKTFLDLDYANDLSNLDESASKMNELLEVLQVQGARIG